MASRRVGPRGIDPVFHGDDERKVVGAIRAFLGRTPDDVLLPGLEHIWRTYQDFQRDLPALARAAKHSMPEAYEYPSYVEFVTAFLKLAR